MGLSKIPQLRARMECLQYKLQCPTKIEELQPALLRIRAATSTMQGNSDNFLKLLEVVLAFGNFLNSGTSKGNAIGFSLRSLEKLQDTKGNDKSNFLGIIVEYIEDHNSDIANWTKDLANIKSAAKVSWDSIQDDLKELQGGLRVCETKVTSVTRGENRYDVFYKLMPVSLDECRKKFEEIDQLNTSVMKDFGELAEKYGEDPSRTKPEEFFTCLTNFMLQYETQTKEFKIKRIQEKKKQLEEKKKNQRLNPTPAPATTPVKTTGNNLSNPTPPPSISTNAPVNPVSNPPVVAKRTGGGAGSRLAKEEPEEKEDTTELVESAINAMNSGRAFARRRLRRQETLRQKEEEAAKLDQ